MIFRNDDVSGNTDFRNLINIYIELKKSYPDSIIYSGVTLFCRQTSKGSVYHDVPFKNKPTEWFYDTNRLIQELDKIPGSVLASHGLYHIDHTKVSYDAQEMSILGSCNYLRTSYFIPPFNRFNEDTERICYKHGIKILAGPPWKSMEFNDFNAEHQYWYFHCWRFTPNKMKKYLRGHR